MKEELSRSRPGDIQTWKMSYTPGCQFHESGQGFGSGITLKHPIHTRVKVMQEICLNCGMSISETMRYCPKCDNALDLQHDGSTITVDIAHHGERVSEALRKMQSEIDLARKDVVMCIRLIVGSGLIRDEVLLALRDLRFRGDVRDFESESSNAGAVLVRLK